MERIFKISLLCVILLLCGGLLTGCHRAAVTTTETETGAENATTTKETVFEDYEEDGLSKYLADLDAEEFKGKACDLASAKGHMSAFYGIWTERADVREWWSDRCTIMEDTINDYEYRVDTMYYYSGDGKERYIMAFHYAGESEGEDSHYIVELDVTPGTGTKDGSVYLYDLVKASDFDKCESNTEYGFCSIDFSQKFETEEELEQAKNDPSHAYSSGGTQSQVSDQQIMDETDAALRKSLDIDRGIDGGQRVGRTNISSVINQGQVTYNGQPVTQYQISGDYYFFVTSGLINESIYQYQFSVTYYRGDSIRDFQNFASRQIKRVYSPF